MIQPHDRSDQRPALRGKPTGETYRCLARWEAITADHYALDSALGVLMRVQCRCADHVDVIRPRRLGNVISQCR